MATLKRLTRGLQKHSISDLLLLGRMTTVGLVLPLALKIWSLPRLLELLDSKAPRTPERDCREIVSMTRALLKLNVGPIRLNCMPKSFILFHVLRRNGHRVKIVFGISESEDLLDGHAWIELDGRPLDEESDPREAFAVAFEYE